MREGFAMAARLLVKEWRKVVVDPVGLFAVVA